MLSRTVPSRKQLLQTIVDGKDFTDEIILRDMEIYSKNLRLNIENLHMFYKKYELEKNL